MTIQPSFSAIEVDANTVDGWLEGQQAVLVDVRETTEYEQEHIPGSVLVPLSVFDPERFPWITNKKLVFHCAVGKRSAAAAKQLMKEGHPQLYNLAGGIQAWKEAGLITEIQFIPPALP
jgi:rhodanese-related sulfurtransferase